MNELTNGRHEYTKEDWQAFTPHEQAEVTTASFKTSGLGSSSKHSLALALLTKNPKNSASFMLLTETGLSLLCSPIKLNIRY